MSEDRRAAAAHARNCPYEPAPCGLGCGAVLPRRLQAEHVEHDCPRAPTLCKHMCAAPLFPRSEIISHEACCPERREECRLGCGAVLPRRLLPTHEDAECPMAIVCCGLGCPASAMRCEWKQKQHEKVCPQQPVPCKQGCGAMPPRCEHDEHVTGVCPHTTVSCARCWRQSMQLGRSMADALAGASMARRDEAAHERSCLSAHVLQRWRLAIAATCEHCGQHFSGSRKCAAHVATLCPEAPVCCPNSRGGAGGGVTGALIMTEGVMTVQQSEGEGGGGGGGCEVCVTNEGGAGCEMVLPRRLLQAHLAEEYGRAGLVAGAGVCAFVRVPCPMACGLTLRRRDLVAHLWGSECERLRPQPCPLGCGALVHTGPWPWLHLAGKSFIVRDDVQQAPPVQLRLDSPRDMHAMPKMQSGRGSITCRNCLVPVKLCHCSNPSHTAEAGAAVVAVLETAEPVRLIMTVLTAWYEPRGFTLLGAVCKTWRAVAAQLRPDHELHTRHCPLLELSCPRGCGARVQRRDLDAHLLRHLGSTPICYHRPDGPSPRDPGQLDAQGNWVPLTATCSLGCGATHVDSEHAKAEHLAACPERPTDCPLGCGFRFPWRERTKHAAVCRMRDELCPYGCGIRLKISLLEIGREALEAAGGLCEACDDEGEFNEAAFSQLLGDVLSVADPATGPSTDAAAPAAAAPAAATPTAAAASTTDAAAAAAAGRATQDVTTRDFLHGSYGGVQAPPASSCGSARLALVFVHGAAEATATLVRDLVKACTAAAAQGLCVVRPVLVLVDGGKSELASLLALAPQLLAAVPCNQAGSLRRAALASRFRARARKSPSVVLLDAAGRLTCGDAVRPLMADPHGQRLHLWDGLLTDHARKCRLFLLRCAALQRLAWHMGLQPGQLRLQPGCACGCSPDMHVVAGAPTPTSAAPRCSPGPSAPAMPPAAGTRARSVPTAAARRSSSGHGRRTSGTCTRARVSWSRGSSS